MPRRETKIASLGVPPPSRRHADSFGEATNQAYTLSPGETGLRLLGRLRPRIDRKIAEDHRITPPAPLLDRQLARRIVLPADGRSVGRAIRLMRDTLFAGRRDKTKANAEHLGMSARQARRYMAGKVKKSTPERVDRVAGERRADRRLRRAAVQQKGPAPTRGGPGHCDRRRRSRGRRCGVHRQATAPDHPCAEP